MARSRRSRAGRRSFRRARTKLDWVQNGFGYSFQIQNVTSGVYSLPLVYSHQNKVGWTDIDQATGPLNQSMSAFPDPTEQAVVRAVRGQIMIWPQGSWIAGQMRWGAMRIGAYVSDPFDGSAVVPQDWTMMDQFNAGGLPYVYADEQFAWERRFRLHFRSDTPLPIINWNVNWSGRKVLQPDEGFFLMMQNPGTEAGDWNAMFWLRTLVEVPAA